MDPIEFVQILGRQAELGIGEPAGLTTGLEQFLVSQRTRELRVSIGGGAAVPLQDPVDQALIANAQQPLERLAVAGGRIDGFLMGLTQGLGQTAHDAGKGLGIVLRKAQKTLASLRARERIGLDGFGRQEATWAGEFGGVRRHSAATTATPPERFLHGVDGPCPHSSEQVVQCALDVALCALGGCQVPPCSTDRTGRPTPGRS